MNIYFCLPPPTLEGRNRTCQHGMKSSNHFLAAPGLIGYGASKNRVCRVRIFCWISLSRYVKKRYRISWSISKLLISFWFSEGATVLLHRFDVFRYYLSTVLIDLYCQEWILTVEYAATSSAASVDTGLCHCQVDIKHFTNLSYEIQ